MDFKTSFSSYWEPPPPLLQMSLLRGLWFLQWTKHIITYECGLSAHSTHASHFTLHEHSTAGHHWGGVRYIQPQEARGRGRAHSPEGANKRAVHSDCQVDGRGDKFWKEDGTALGRGKEGEPGLTLSILNDQKVSTGGGERIACKGNPWEWGTAQGTVA